MVSWKHRPGTATIYLLTLLSSLQDASPRAVAGVTKARGISLHLQNRLTLWARQGRSLLSFFNMYLATILISKPVFWEGRLQFSLNTCDYLNLLFCIVLVSSSIKAQFLTCTPWQWCGTWSEWRLPRAWLSYSQSVECHLWWGYTLGYPFFQLLSQITRICHSLIYPV